MSKILTLWISDEGIMHLKSQCLGFQNVVVLDSGFWFSQVFWFLEVKINDPGLDTLGFG